MIKDFVSMLNFFQQRGQAVSLTPIFTIEPIFIPPKKEKRKVLLRGWKSDKKYDIINR
jgi:hypothetical protein